MTLRVVGCVDIYDLKDFDDGVLLSELLDVWIYRILRIVTMVYDTQSYCLCGYIGSEGL
jgi:hypothetical protein